MKVAVLGAGAFGTALAIALARDGAAVGLWARDAAQADAMRASRENARYLPGCRLPGSVAVSAEMDQFSAADIILAAVPTRAMGALLADLEGSPGRVDRGLREGH